jgi:hypothetical protein
MKTYRSCDFKWRPFAGRCGRELHAGTATHKFVMRFEHALPVAATALNNSSAWRRTSGEKTRFQ